ncbi:histidine phosphatase family protein [Silvibacterium acidisoli]|uniref:histidine phosphatase family protein n=1 Tax=Acidobacteriaceae bacterium ZG23-2 TaxID=2883246 RepID=UPI00406D4DFB
MKRLILIRHAETDMAGTFCGHSDPPVNARGLQQISTLQQSLANEQIEAIISSDLLRARQTATALAEYCRSSLTYERDLREIHFGHWEGLTWGQLEKQFPAQSRQWLQRFPVEAAPGGEGYDLFRSRVCSALDHIHAHVEDTVAVVTHAGVLRIALQHLIGTSFEEAQARQIGYATFFTYTAAEGAA